MKLVVHMWGRNAAVRLPPVLLEHLGAGTGSSLKVDLIAGGKAVIAVYRPKYKLADLTAESVNNLPVVEGWDELPLVGSEAPRQVDGR